MSDTYLFEASWEVCNKVGGIFTVIKSKVIPMQKKYLDKYFLIGPYEFENAKNDFEQQAVPDFLKEIFQELMPIGIICHYGKWITEGHPQVILIEFSNYTYNNNYVKTLLWENFKIDSLGTAFYDFDRPVLWAWCVGILLEKIKAKINSKMVAHVHEWLSGAAILYLKIKRCQIATVFTTHATVLGRSLAGSSRNIYEILTSLNPEQEAINNNVLAKFHLEKQSALQADIFTTVSELTADEAEKILGRRPDVITYNGLNIESIPGIEEVSHSKRRSRLRMLELIMSYFFPNFHFELNETVIFGTFGRYEFHVKGMDVISKALGILNKRLKDENSPKNIVCLYFIPAGVSGIREELLLSKSKLADVKETLENNKDLINFSLLKHLIEGKKLSGHSIFTEDHMNELNSKIKRFNIPIPVLYSTHYLSNYDSDPIINSFKQAELHNNSTDKVRVIFYPLYLNGFDGLLDLEYHEAIQGLDLGLFPSFYEPWGYTPFETASYGVPAITTNVSGFGLFIKSISHENKGIYVIDRRNRSVDEVSQELAEVMHKIIHMSKAERDQLRTVTRALTEKADWKIFANYYFDSHQKALDKTYPK